MGNDVTLTIDVNSQFSKDDGARQIQKSSVPMGGIRRLPFYYESNSTKSYKESWVFRVVEDGTGWEGVSDISQCGIGPDSRGKDIDLVVEDAGWRFGTSPPCQGKWKKVRQSLEQGDL
jgi:hypothetical protein